ncbi:DNA polymerase III subunit delta, partial [Vibrio vulnificus]|nr:DNA polymerase III subunit delta [Vibrio vulnificus]
LLYPDGELNLIRLEESLSRHNHFTVFHWIDALLEGKANRCQKILRQLEAEDIEAIILLRSLQKELLLLLQMQQQLQQSSMMQVFEKHRIWQNKKPLYTAALTRLKSTKLRQLLTLLAKAEILAKTQYEQPVWPILQQLSVEMSLPDVELAFKS